MTIRPWLWPALSTAVMLAALVGLGTWQLQRHAWKTDLIDTRVARAMAAAIDLPVELPAPETFEFRRVRLSGTYLNDRELYLVGRIFRGAPGLHVLTPFRRADGGGVELIDRGWAPLDRRAPATRASGQLDGRVVVEGVVRLAAKPGTFTPDNEPQNNNWFFIEFDAMAKVAGVGSLPRYYIRATAPNTPGRFPVAHRFQPNLPNTHLAYAVTWYILAVALIAVYIVFLLRQRGT